MAVSHGAACYRDSASPPAQSHELSSAPGCVKVDQDTGYVGCAFQSPALGSLSILVLVHRALDRDHQQELLCL